MRTSEARFRSLIENASDLILLASETGKLLYASPSSYSVMGYSPDLLVGRSFRDFTLREEESIVDQIFSDSNFPSNNNHRFELHVRHSDGSLRLLDGVAANLLSDPAVAGILINARDMSERRKAERALENTNEDLRRANDDLSVFAYCASHDLQEPLRNVSLYCQMLQRQYSGRLGAQADEFIGHVIEGSARMSNLVKDLLTYLDVSGSRAHSIPALIPVEFAITQALSNLGTGIRSTEATVVYEGLPAVPVEPVHLQQLFQNLISNAIKYRGVEAPRVQISAQAEKGYWCFSVKDNGIGISSQYTNSVFRLFKRLHGRGEYPVLALGSQSARKLSSETGAASGWNHNQGKAAISDLLFRNVNSHEHDDMSRNSLVVFLVEDNPANVFFVRTALESEGIDNDIFIAQDGERLSHLSRPRILIRKHPVRKSYFSI